MAITFCLGQTLTSVWPETMGCDLAQPLCEWIVSSLVDWSNVGLRALPSAGGGRISR